jgi:hypothetical protein
MAAPALPGSTVSVSAPGYLPRVQLFNGPVYLWPQDEAFVRQLVYGETFGGVLTRWARGFSIAAPGHEDLAAQVAAEVTRATGLPVTISASTTDHIVGNVVTTVDEADPYWAENPTHVGYCTADVAGHTIVSANLHFRNHSRVVLNTFLHEMGHCLGLGHIDPVEGPDVMNPFLNSARAYSVRETIALRMMYARRTAGNAPPDREGTSASSTQRTIVFVD